MGCDDPNKRGLPPGPWRAVRVAFHADLVLAILRGEDIALSHPSLPRDAVVIGAKMNGTHLELIVQSSYFPEVGCQCNFTTLRVKWGQPEAAGRD